MSGCRNNSSGVSFEDFKLQTKNQFLTQRVISEEVYRNIKIPKADIEKYYNEHKSEFIRQEMVSLREILISAGDGSPEKVAAAEKKAKGLVDRARKGEKFYRPRPAVFRRGDRNERRRTRGIQARRSGEGYRRHRLQTEQGLRDRPDPQTGGL